MKPIILIALIFFFKAVTQAQPIINSFSPTSGPAGTIITITGSNFNSTAANNTVYFGPVKATVLSASSTGLSVTVPPGGGYNSITVLNTATRLIGYSSKPFVPSFTMGSGQNITSASFRNPVNIVPAMGVYWSPRAVASGDIDGDGKPDLVTISSDGIGSPTNTLSILRNISTSSILTNNSFANRVDFSIPYSPTDLQISDLDGDGKLDIAVAYLGASTVTVLRNTSTAGTINTSSLSAGISVPTGDGSNRLYIQDFDKDGKSDIAAINSNQGSQNSISVMRNISSAGTIAFSAPQLFATGRGIKDMTVGDLNADNKPDIVTANSDDNNISVLINTSSTGSINSSSFATISISILNTSLIPSSVAISDFDNDGKPDIALGGGAILKNLFSGGTFISTSLSAEKFFSLPGYYISVADVNGDGKPDIISGGDFNGINIAQNMTQPGIIENTSFLPPINFNIGMSPYQHVLSDLDGDGRMDIIASNKGFSGLNTSLGILQNAIGIANTGQGNGKIQPSAFYLKMHVNDTANISAKLYNTDGTLATIQPSFSWSSGNSAIASVNNNGQIIAKSLGTAYITVANVAFDSATINVQVVADTTTIPTGPANIVFSPFIASMKTNDKRRMPEYVVTDFKGKTLSFQPSFKMDSILSATIFNDTITSGNKVGLYDMHAFNGTIQLYGTLPVFIYDANTTTVKADTLYKARLRTAPAAFNKYNLEAKPVQFDVSRIITPAHSSGSYVVPVLTQYVDKADSVVATKTQIVSVVTSGNLKSNFPGSTKINAWYKGSYYQFTSHVAFDFSGSWSGIDQNNKSYKICFSDISPEIVYTDGNAGYPNNDVVSTSTAIYQVFPDVVGHWTQLYYPDTMWGLNFPPQIARIYPRIRLGAPIGSSAPILDAAWSGDINHFTATDGSGMVTPNYPPIGVVNFSRGGGCGQDSLEKVLSGNNIKSWIYDSDSLFDYTPGEIYGYTTFYKSSHKYTDFELGSNGVTFYPVENGTWSVQDNNKLIGTSYDTTYYPTGVYVAGNCGVVFHPAGSSTVTRHITTFFISSYSDSLIKIDSANYRHIEPGCDITNSEIGPVYIYVYNPPGGALPLRFLAFEAISKDRDVLLKWVTNNEINTSHFNAQRSIDGIHFSNIGRIQALNSINSADYNFTDVGSLRLGYPRIYYRLEQIDNDGKSTYSKVVMINSGKSLNLNVAPNPAQNAIRITSNKDIGKALVNLVDINGRVVYSSMQTFGLSQEVVIEIQDLIPGIYVLLVKNSFVNEQVKIIKQ